MSDRHEAMKRLGAEMVECPVCHKRFKLAQELLWFVLRMVNGETVDDDKNDDPFCSNRCASERADELNRNVETGVLYIPWGNPGWTR